MSVKMILQDGPLDKEEQLVVDLNTTAGWEMQFNIPNYQTFDADGESVLGMGLVAVYSYLGPGPDPNPDAPDYDTWTSSSIYEFTGEYFIPRPPPLVPPGPMPIPPAVFMGALSGLTVNADDPSPGVQLVGEGDMTVDATTISFGYGSVILISETFMILFRQPLQDVVALSASTIMNITPN